MSTEPDRDITPAPGAALITPAEPAVKHYRKKPVTVATLEWTGSNIAALREFTGDRGYLDRTSGPLRIWNTEEGDWITCPVGHSVVRGRLGEFYPISPAALEATYEPAGDVPDE